MFCVRPRIRAALPEFTDKVFAAIRRVPRGKVASYGLIAQLAGYPRAARQVGMVMRLGHGLPWWRIVAKDGRIAIADPQWKMEQAIRLEAEGVIVRQMRVDYERFVWQPPLSDARTSRSRSAKAPARPATAARAPSRASAKGRAAGTKRPPRTRGGSR